MSYSHTLWILEERCLNTWICTAHSQYIKNLYWQNNGHNGLMHEQYAKEKKDIVESYSMSYQFCRDLYHRHAKKSMTAWDHKDTQTFDKYEISSKFATHHPYQIRFTNFDQKDSIRLDERNLARFVKRIHFLKSLEPLCHHKVDISQDSPFAPIDISAHERIQDARLKSLYPKDDLNHPVQITLYVSAFPSKQ